MIKTYIKLYRRHLSIDRKTIKNIINELIHSPPSTSPSSTHSPRTMRTFWRTSRIRNIKRNQLSPIFQGLITLHIQKLHRTSQTRLQCTLIDSEKPHYQTPAYRCHEQIGVFSLNRWLSLSPSLPLIVLVHQCHKSYQHSTQQIQNYLIVHLI